MAGDGKRALDALTTEMGRVGGAVRGTQPAVTAVMQSFMLLGRQVPPQIGGISNALASLAAGGFTPVGLALAAVTAGIALFASTQQDATEKTDAHTAALKAQADRMKELADAAARAELKARAGAAGKDVDLQEIDEGIADAQQRIAFQKRQIDALPRYAQTHGAMQEEIRRELAKAEADLRRLGYERELVLRRMRAEAPPRPKRVYDPAEEKRKTEEVLALLRKARGEADPAEAPKSAPQPPADGPPVSPAVAALRAEVEQLRRATEGRREALKVLRGWGTETEVALQSAREAFANARDGGADSDELSAMAERIQGLRELVDLERQHAEVQKSLDDQEAASKAAKEQADRDRKAQEQRARQAEEFAERLREVEADLAFDLAQGDRTETERRMAEYARRYEDLLEQAREYGFSTLEIERLIAEGQKRIREQAAADEVRDAERRRGDQTSAAVSGPDLDAGFRARITQLREETSGWGRLGAQIADVAVNDISGGVARALEDVARGSKSASEAFREFAANFALEVARMIQQALIMKAILSLFPGLSSAGGAGAGGAGAGAAAAPAATAAHGGSFRVGGVGGLDSQLVAMKVSPGELIRVTDGANSAGERGDVHVALTVRPPAVIADDVMARASPEARAAVVGTALRRPGRRGMRARE